MGTFTDVKKNAKQVNVSSHISATNELCFEKDIVSRFACFLFCITY